MKFDRESLRSIQSFLPVQLFIGYCFCVSGLIVNVLQLLTYICIWPFNKELYRRLNYHLGTLIWSQLTCLYSWWSNSSVTLYGDPEDVRLLQNEYAMVLVNHRYEIDWLTGMVISQRLGLLGGSKIVGKRSLSLIPILGWSWSFTESIFLRRVWESDKKVLERDIQRIVDDYPKGYYFNFMMACEGTRFTEAKREDSARYARDHNLPELKYHILPRSKGFAMIMHGSKGRIPAVYNFMLAFPKDSAPPTFRTLLKGHSCRAQLYIKRTPVSQIPCEDEKKCGEWLRQLFQEKDRIYDHFVRRETFDGLGVPEVPCPRNWSDLTVQLLCFVIVGIPSLVWLVRFLVASSWVGKLILAVALLIAYVIGQWMINMSVIKTDTKVKKS